MTSQYPTLSATEDQNVWKLEIICDDREQPLQQERIVCFVEAVRGIRNPKTLFIFYDHHEHYTRDKKNGPWRKDGQDITYHLSRDLKRELYAMAHVAWWNYFFGFAGDIPQGVGYWKDREQEKNKFRTVEGPTTIQ